MKIIDKIEIEKKNTLRRKELIEIINPFVEKAFGKGYRGDYIPYYDNIIIGKDNECQLMLISDGSNGVGHFNFDIAGKEIDKNERDGSVITVRPEYRNQAEEYARFYEQEFKKEVTLVLNLYA
ncbi:hypothetical protein J4461_00695 [Candidatus Pacearchaeota archaeon]|nr:hypothetical protein [Candidatus Pacearchaeota archaeon]